MNTWIDIAELKTRLRARGKVSVRTKKPLNPSFLHGKDMFVIGGLEHPWIFGRGADRWDEEEVNIIQRFVARGGALLVMGDSLASAERMNAVAAPFGTAFSGNFVGDVTVSGESIFPHPVTKGVEEIVLGKLPGGGGNYLQVNEPAIVLAQYEGRPVLAYSEYEKGRVVVLSSLCALSNRYIGAKDNATLLENILNHLLIPRIVAVSSERIAHKPLAPTRLSRAFLGFAFRLMRSGSRLGSLRQPPGGSDPADGDALASLRLANARLRPSGG